MTIHTNPSIAHGFPGDDCLESKDTPQDNTELDRFIVEFEGGYLKSVIRKDPAMLEKNRTILKDRLHKYVREAYRLGRGHQAEEMNTAGTGDMGTDIAADNERWERHTGELNNLLQEQENV